MYSILDSGRPNRSLSPSAGAMRGSQDLTIENHVVKNNN